MVGGGEDERVCVCGGEGKRGRPTTVPGMTNAPNQPASTATACPLYRHASQLLKLPSTTMACLLTASQATYQLSPNYLSTATQLPINCHPTTYQLPPNYLSTATQLPFNCHPTTS